MMHRDGLAVGKVLLLLVLIAAGIVLPCRIFGHTNWCLHAISRCSRYLQ